MNALFAAERRVYSRQDPLSQTLPESLHIYAAYASNVSPLFARGGEQAILYVRCGSWLLNTTRTSSPCPLAYTVGFKALQNQKRLRIEPHRTRG